MISRKLIDNPTKARTSVRGVYEARSVGGESRSVRGDRARGGLGLG